MSAADFIYVQMNEYSKKLNEEKVMAIMAGTRFNRQIAKIYGVSYEIIRKIKNRKTWIHVGGALCIVKPVVGMTT